MIATRGCSGRVLPIQTAICPAPASSPVHLLVKQNTALSQSHWLPPLFPSSRSVERLTL